jgi:hypothetical protein
MPHKRYATSCGAATTYSAALMQPGMSSERPAAQPAEVALCVDARHEKKTGCQRIGDIFSSIFGDPMDTEDGDEDVAALTRDCHDAMSLEDYEVEDAGVTEDPLILGAMSTGASNQGLARAEKITSSASCTPQRVVKCYEHSCVPASGRLNALWEAGMKMAGKLHMDFTGDKPVDVRDLEYIDSVNKFAETLIANADAKGMEMGYPGPGNLSRGNGFYGSSAVAAWNIWPVTKSKKSIHCPRWVNCESARAAIWFYFGGELEKHTFGEGSVELDGLDLRGMMELACVYSMFNLKQSKDVCTNHPAKMCAFAVSAMVENSKRETVFTNNEIRKLFGFRSMIKAFDEAGLRGLTIPEFLNSKKLVITFSKLYEQDMRRDMECGIVKDRSSDYLFEPSIKVRHRVT